MNPEFQRNLWLHWSLPRALLLPGLLLLVLALVVSMSAEGYALSTLHSVFAVLGSSFAGIWGSMLVGASVRDELLERTWDQQRLSSLSPWQMAWGKLLGASSLAWYAALLCAAVTLLTGTRLLPLLPAAVMGALALQAWVMAAHLGTLDMQDSAVTHGAARNTTGITAAAVLMLHLAAITALGQPLDLENGWWGLGLRGWSLGAQLALLAALALALGLLALWRTMSTQLMVRTLPWAWPLGNVALGAMLAGFVFAQPEASLHLSVPLALALAIFTVAWIGGYAQLISRGAADSRLLRWQALHWHARQRQWQRWWQELPLWPISVALALLVALWLLALDDHGIDGDLRLSGSWALALTLYLLRDAALVLLFAWSGSQRPVGMTMLTAVVLGGMLPTILLALDMPPSAGLWLQPLLGLERGYAHPWIWPALALHLLALAALLAWRWRRSGSMPHARPS